MSVISLSTGEPTCTVEDLHKVAEANNISIDSGSQNEQAFLRLANSFDAVCKTIHDLPEYEDPRTTPCEVEGERKYYRPDDAENPLNAWAYRTKLKARSPEAANGPLVGKTVAIKDNMSVAGLPLGLGTSPKVFTEGQAPVSPIDSIVVKRILEAGGTITGTGTCENLSIFPASYSSDSGVVHNPWLLGYATGGSSSGCGSLISISDVEEARRTGKDKSDHPLGEGVDIGVGGDQGGSIRLPAAYSGLYGLKPTHGLVPYTGIASLHPLVDHAGPMARTVEDTATLLGVLAGYDEMDPRMTPETPLRSQVPDYKEDLESWVEDKQSRGEWTSTTASKGLRIGILRDAFDIARLESSVEPTLNAAIDRFKALGADVHEVSVPLHKHGGAIWTVATRPLIAHFLANKPPDVLSHTMPHVDPIPMGQEMYDTIANRNAAPLNMAMNATQMEAKYGNRLNRKAYMHVFELRAAYDKALEGFDVLLTPVTPTVGPKIPVGAYKTAENPNGFSEDILEMLKPIIGNTLNTAPFNVSGHPAMSMPVGWGRTEDGKGRLPVGLQLVAKRWDEASIFKAAKSWEVRGSWKGHLCGTA